MNRTEHNRTSVSRLAIAGLAASCLSFTTPGRAALVSGGVLDGTTGQPLSGVQVYVDGVSTGASTDAGGKFQVDIAAGEKVLSLKKDGFIEQSLGKVEIAADGEKFLPNAKLYTKPADDVVMLDALSVEGSVVKNSVVTARQNADVSVDLLSSADFGKFIGTDVADIVVRIPGLSTTSQGSFAVVRGLAERYNPVMLDGIVLPSSDPERQSPELDIFPARLVDAIVISKTYEARLPGAASGAAIDLRTKPLPEGRFAQVQIGLRADEGYINNDSFLTSAEGGSWDQIGFGSKSRVQSADRPIGGPAIIAFTRAPSTVTGLKNSNFPIGRRFSLTYEDLVVLNEKRGSAFGYSIAVTQDTSASTEDGEKFRVPSVYINGGTAAANGSINNSLLDYSGGKYIESELETSTGLLLGAGYAFNAKHQVGVKLFGSQVGIDSHSREYSRYSLNNATFNELQVIKSIVETLPNPQANDQFSAIDSYSGAGGAVDQIYYRQRQLLNSSASGQHKFFEDDRAEVSWNVARIQATQEEPNTFTLPYSVSPVSTTHSSSFTGGSDLGRYNRYWRNTEESTWAGRVDGDFKADVAAIEDVNFKAGFYTEESNRNYDEQSYFLNGGSVSGSDYASYIAAFQNYDNNNANPFIRESFASGDRSLNSGYLSATIPIVKERSFVKRLDLVLGARLESYELNSSGLGRLGNESSFGLYNTINNLTGQPALPLSQQGNPFVGQIKEDKILPAISLNYSPTKPLKIRLSASETVARPSFREVGSYFTVDSIADEYVHGNYQLETSKVTNYDFRIEYFFPDSTDLVALSLFSKTIDNPIERVSFDFGFAGPVSTFANNPASAELFGLELEFAKSMGFLGELGENFILGGNITLIDATVDRNPSFESQAINEPGIADSRALTDQPEWIANTYVSFNRRPWGFSTTLSYFAISDVLQKVNVSAWDTYVESYGRLDLTLSQKLSKSLTLRVSAKNLLDPTRRLVADPENTSDRIVYRSYQDGRSYSVTLVYDF